MGRPLLVHAGRLIDGTGSGPIAGATLVIEDGRICSVHGPGQESPAPPDAEVIDATGQTVLPGLVDSHVHLCFSAGPEPLADALRESEPQQLLRAAGNAQRALAAGITTVRDCGGLDGATLALRDALDAGVIVGPRLQAAGPPLTTTAGHLHFCGLEVQGVDDLRRAVRQLHKRRVDYIKVMVTGGYMTPRTNPFALQYTPAELSAIADDAHRLGLRVAGHIASIPGIRAGLDAGLDTFEHCVWHDQTAPGVLRYDAALGAAMARQGCGVGLTIGGGERQLAQSVAAGESLPLAALPRLEALTHIHEQMRADGVVLACHSDAGTVGCTFGGLALSVAALVRLYQWNPLAAITAVTGTAAQVMGLADDVGTLTAGRRADLIVVDGDPSVTPEALLQVDRVLLSGRTVARHGHLLLTHRD